MIRALILLAGLGSSPPAAAGFPHEYQGRWGEDLEGCSPGAIHGGLTITLGAVRDGEFSGSVRSVRHKPDGSIDVVERWELPEEDPTNVLANYRLTKDKKSLTVREHREGAEAYTLIRCKVVK